MNKQFQIYFRSNQPINIFDIKREINLTTHIGLGENTNVKGKHGIIEVAKENDVTPLLLTLQYQNSKTYIRYIPQEEMNQYKKVLIKNVNPNISNTQLFHRLSKYGKIIEIEEFANRKYVLCSNEVGNMILQQKEELKIDLCEEDSFEFFDIKIEQIGYELLVELPLRTENSEELFQYFASYGKLVRYYFYQIEEILDGNEMKTYISLVYESRENADSFFNENVNKDVFNIGFELKIKQKYISQTDEIEINAMKTHLSKKNPWCLYALNLKDKSIDEFKEFLNQHNVENVSIEDGSCIQFGHFFKIVFPNETNVDNLIALNGLDCDYVFTQKNGHLFDSFNDATKQLYQQIGNDHKVILKNLPAYLRKKEKLASECAQHGKLLHCDLDSMGYGHVAFVDVETITLLLNKNIQIFTIEKVE